MKNFFYLKTFVLDLTYDPYQELSYRMDKDLQT